MACIPCSLGSNCDFLTVRSKGESWSAMRSLLSTGFWALAPAMDEATGDAFSRLWFFVLLGELESWVELVFEVYSAANCRIIRCMISRATKGMLGSETLGLSKRHKIWNSNIQKKCKLELYIHNLHSNIFRFMFNDFKMPAQDWHIFIIWCGHCLISIDCRWLTE